MCDYSLEMYRSRPARIGEQYVTSHFPSRSIGLTAPGDCHTAVCLMADTRLKLQDIPDSAQKMFGLHASEEAIFVRREMGSYRDAIRFANGAEVLLQQLGSGVKVSIIEALERPLALKRPGATERREREPA